MFLCISSLIDLLPAFTWTYLVAEMNAGLLLECKRRVFGFEQHSVAQQEWGVAAVKAEKSCFMVSPTLQVCDKWSAPDSRRQRKKAKALCLCVQIAFIFLCQPLLASSANSSSTMTAVKVLRAKLMKLWDESAVLYGGGAACSCAHTCDQTLWLALSGGRPRHRRNTQPTGWWCDI